MPVYADRSYSYNSVYCDTGRFEGDPSNPQVRWASTNMVDSIPPIPLDKKWLTWVKIPAGSKEIRWKLKTICSAHNACFQVFHHGTGNLLIGTPFSLSTYQNTSAWNFPSTLPNIGGTSGYYYDESRYATFYSYLQAGNWATAMFPMWMNTFGLSLNSSIIPGGSDSSLIKAYEVFFGEGAYKKAFNWDESVPVWQGLPPSDSTTQVDDYFRICLGKTLSKLYPDVFPDIFVPKDSLVNGTGLPYFKIDNDLHYFNVESEGIYWTGNLLGGLDGSSSKGVVTDDSAASGWIDTSDVASQAAVFTPSLQQPGHFLARFEEALTYDQAQAKGLLHKNNAARKKIAENIIDSLKIIS